MVAASWGLHFGRAREPERVALVAHENVITAFVDGEFLRTTRVVAPSSPRGRRHATEADDRMRQRATGVVTRLPRPPLPHGARPRRASPNFPERLSFSTVGRPNPRNPGTRNVLEIRVFALHWNLTTVDSIPWRKMITTTKS